MIDLSTIKSKRAFFKSALPTPEDLKKYMRNNGVLNFDELKIFQDKVANRIKEAESSWLKKILSTIYYYAKGQVRIDLETLYWLMANFDQIASFMPNEFWKKVIMSIDKIGENLLAMEKEKE